MSLSHEDYLLLILADGRWHSLAEILRRHPMMVHSRAAGLRAKGYTVENRIVGKGAAGSEYRLVSEGDNGSSETHVSPRGDSRLAAPSETSRLVGALTEGADGMAQGPSRFGPSVSAPLSDGEQPGVGALTGSPAPVPPAETGSSEGPNTEGRGRSPSLSGEPLSEGSPVAVAVGTNSPGSRPLSESGPLTEPGATLPLPSRSQDASGSPADYTSTAPGSVSGDVPGGAGPLHPAPPAAQLTFEEAA